MTDAKAHWEGVYTEKATDEVGWYKPTFDVSLNLISEAAASATPRIIDIGGGASLFVDNLLERGYDRVAVLDIAEASLNRAKERLGERAAKIDWIVADIREATNLGLFDIWHDRAVFHFLVESQDRQRYASLARGTVPVGGHLIISTFSPEGPEKCSGLNTCRYSSASLAAELGDSFALVKEVPEIHVTPRGKSQAFVYALLRRVADR